jgi:hypothetical protein
LFGRGIGRAKAEALRDRVIAIDDRISVEAFRRDAYQLLHSDIQRFRSYDLILDCTASLVLQMKIERRWEIFGDRTPPMICLIIDAAAEHCLGIVVSGNSRSGPWDAYVQLKRRLCLDGRHERIVRAFYSRRAAEKLFQPEPGCSDPTFSGSASDVLSLACTSLNIGLDVSKKHAAAPSGFAFSVARRAPINSTAQGIPLALMREINVGDYRVRIAQNVFVDARGWVHQNNRLRSRNDETGGLLWGLWDDAVGIIWVFDLSGPPPDSVHDAGHFICGTVGTTEEHNRRVNRSYGTCGFIGFWHTHPSMEPRQSGVDVLGMGTVVAGRVGNQRRALMLIFGRTTKRPSAGVYIYESDLRSSQRRERIFVHAKEFGLRAAVV